MQKPEVKPNHPFFSSGPCSKRPGWNLESLNNAFLGRSHRAKNGKAKLNEVIVKSKELLELPADYLVGIVPASDTGAIEMAMWSLLGQRGVDVCGWESFGLTWVKDITKQLKLNDVNIHDIKDYGELPDLSKVNFDNDVVFTWNGTTSGVCVPNADWIPNDRNGLAICDATSAVFAMDMDFTKLDVVTWSWQKVLGGEAAHGMIALSPRAVERLETYEPSWPMPKIFQLAKNKKLDNFSKNLSSLTLYKLSQPIIGIILPIIIILIWHFLALTETIRSNLLPSPQEVINEILILSRDGTLFSHILITLSRVFYGFIFDEISMGAGGFNEDFKFTKKSIALFSQNSILESIYLFSETSNRPPLIYIMHKILNPFFTDELGFRKTVFGVSLLIPILFFLCLKEKFHQENKNLLLLLSSIIFFNPFYRTSSFWGLEENYAILTTLVSILFLIKIFQLKM